MLSGLLVFPSNSDMDYRILNVNTWPLCVRVHTRIKHTDNESAQHFDSDYIGLDYITFLCQCNARGIQAALPGESEQHYPAFSFCFSCVQRFRVSIPAAVRPTLLRQLMDMGSLTCSPIWVLVVFTTGQAQTCLQKSWLGATYFPPLTLPHQGIEPRVFGFEFRLSNCWVTSPVYSLTAN